MKTIKTKDIKGLDFLLDELDVIDESLKSLNLQREQNVIKINKLLVKLEGQDVLDAEYNKTTKEIRYMTKACIELKELGKNKSKKH